MTRTLQPANAFNIVICGLGACNDVLNVASVKLFWILSIKKAKMGKANLIKLTIFGHTFGNFVQNLCQKITKR